MKRIRILMFVLLVIGFVRRDARVTREQDPLSRELKDDCAETGKLSCPSSRDHSSTSMVSG